MTLCWSAEVVLYACLPKGVPAFATTCMTSLAGAALLLVPFRRRVAAALREGGARFALAGLGLAALSSGYNTLFLFGMKSLDVESGAFSCLMTMVVLPLVLLSMRRRVERGTWLSGALVLAGIVLALDKSVHWANAPALGVIGAGCLLRAVLIVLLSDLVKKHDPVAVAVLLEGFAGLFSLGGWFADDPRLFAGLPFSRTLVAAWAIYAYFIVAFATSLNAFAMRRVTAANATVVYSLEIVFTLAWGLLLPAGVVDRIELAPRVALGAALVVAGSLSEIFDLGGGGGKEAPP